METLRWHIRGRVIEFGCRPLVMGIVNVTPDSFSDGGHFIDPHRAVDHALQLVGEGADILDIGGESTRPGAEPVPLDEELRRVVPVITELSSRADIPISVDTMKPEVARQCLDAGAAIINDVSGFRNPAMIALAVDYRPGLVVMHMRGLPPTMQNQPQYRDVVGEIAAFFDDRLTKLSEAGVAREAITLDPGIGFGKTLDHNLEIIANLGSFCRFGRPVCLGVSRKGFIGKICGREKRDRLAGSLAIAAFAAARGQAQLLRVHDVAPTRDAAVLLDAIDRHRH